MVDLLRSSESGVVYQVNDIDRLRRFLCFGSENGTFYIGQKELGMQNVDCVKRLIEAKRGVEVVDELVSFSVEGRVAKQDSLLLAFAMCARLGDNVTKRRAYDAMNRVCRIPTHLFQFIELCEQMSVGSGRGSGWGRAHRNAIRRWYTRFHDNPLRLAQHVTKYQKRKGWSHVDVLRLAHPKPKSDSVNVVLRYVTKGLSAAVQAFPSQSGTPIEIVHTLSFLKAVEEVKRLGNTPDDVQHACEAIRNHNLVREHIPTQMLNSVDVWKALLINMPLNAMIRNLGKMTSMSMLGPGSEGADLVIKKLHDDAALKYARIHPFNVLLSMLVYKRGHGEKSDLRWQANTEIVNAMDDAFYLSFKYVESTNKRYCLAVDVSGSMNWPVTGCELINARESAAVMSMVTLRSEENCEVVGFSVKLRPINLTRDMTLPDVINTIDHIPMGGTDCAAPMLWAMEQKKKFDVFIVYTDSETQSYRVTPTQALKNYRRQSGINAKLIVCAFASNGFTIADPNDPGMLDMTGFDSNGPAIMNTFITAM